MTERSNSFLSPMMAKTILAIPVLGASFSTAAILACAPAVDKEALTISAITGLSVLTGTAGALWPSLMLSATCLLIFSKVAKKLVNRLNKDFVNKSLFVMTSAFMITSGVGAHFLSKSIAEPHFSKQIGMSSGTSNPSKSSSLHMMENKGQLYACLPKPIIG